MCHTGILKLLCCHDLEFDRIVRCFRQKTIDCIVFGKIATFKIHGKRLDSQDQL